MGLGRAVASGRGSYSLLSHDLMSHGSAILSPSFAQVALPPGNVHIAPKTRKLPLMIPEKCLTVTDPVQTLGS